MASIRAPILIVLGDYDFVRLEHTIETFEAIPGAEIAVVPDASRFALFSEQERVIPMVQHFWKRDCRWVAERAITRAKPDN